MKQVIAIKKSLDQAFWSVYPLIAENSHISFEEIYGVTYDGLTATQYQQYKNVFFDMVQGDELPLIPVIPVNNEEVFSLEYQ